MGLTVNCNRPFDISYSSILKMMLDTTISSELRDTFCYSKASNKKPHVFQHLNLCEVIKGSHCQLIQFIYLYFAKN
jgi:hypothetical protein